MTAPDPRPPAEPEPTDPTERIIIRLDKLISAAESGTMAVAKERRWRRFSFLLLTAATVAGMVLGSWTWRVERADRLRSERQTCVDRRTRAEENRRVQERVAAYEARFYGRPDPEATRLSKGVAAIVAESLPLPEC